ncbi:MAG: PTS transporter subunit EIIA, partial [Enterococcus cecorum]|nr:PTS transporter subunit EIIA [Enterococcus cecorum]
GEYFAVFTTIPLKNVSSSIPIIRITNLFNDNWLRSAWDKATKIRKSPLKYTELMFHSYHSTGNYKKDLINITQELVLNGNVDSYFSNRLIERENKGSTVFEQKIAFPHAINLASQQIFLMIAKPDNNMNHLSENNEVDLIVLLAIPSDLTKNSEEELMQIYEQIFATTSNMEQLYKLKLAKNLDDIMEIFGWKG